jgi:hypothetical protein
MNMKEVPSNDQGAKQGKELNIRKRRRRAFGKPKDIT